MAGAVARPARLSAAVAPPLSSPKPNRMWSYIRTCGRWATIARCHPTLPNGCNLFTACPSHALFLLPSPAVQVELPMGPGLQLPDDPGGCGRALPSHAQAGGLGRKGEREGEGEPLFLLLLGFPRLKQAGMPAGTVNWHTSPQLTSASAYPQPSCSSPASPAAAALDCRRLHGLLQRVGRLLLPAAAPLPPAQAGAARHAHPQPLSLLSLLRPLGSGAAASGRCPAAQPSSRSSVSSRGTPLPASCVSHPIY